MAVNGLTEIEESAIELIKTPSEYEIIYGRTRLSLSWTVDQDV